MQATLFEELGGEPVLRAIIDRFVDRVVNDTMIGFFFARVNKDRLKQMEYEFAAQHLGANIVYSGRPIHEAHRRHAIMGGQFRRRLVLLEQTLAEFQVPAHIVDHWVAHTMALEGSVTPDADGRCIARAEDTRES